MFGREASGYGLNGYDGKAEERLEAMKITGKRLEQHRSLLQTHEPDVEKVGVYFDIDTYNLEWAKDGQADRAMKSIYGYCKAMERMNIPYTLIESHHLNSLQDIKVLFMPFPIVVPEEASLTIQRFVNDGGTLLVEAEANAFNFLGFYSYPGKDRSFAYALGIEDTGRRVVEDKVLKLKYKGDEFPLNMS